MTKTKTPTNITETHMTSLELIRGLDADEIALFSCFINDEPGCAICKVVTKNGELHIMPLFVSITKGMKLTNHDGQSPKSAKERETN